MSADYYTTKIRCLHCNRLIDVPGDLVRDYEASGGMIQTIYQSIVAQPIHRHYHTPVPVLRAIALFIPIVSIGAPASMYYGVSPLTTSIVMCFAAGVLMVWALTDIEMEETAESSDDIDDSDHVDDTPPQRFEEIERGHNRISIKWTHEPPHSHDPRRQKTLSQADVLLARLATGENPIAPVSFAAAKRAGFKFGEPTFYEVQRRWVSEGLAFRAENGNVFLRESGRRTLKKYSSPPTP